MNCTNNISRAAAANTVIPSFKNAFLMERFTTAVKSSARCALSVMLPAGPGSHPDPLQPQVFSFGSEKASFMSGISDSS